MIDKISFKELWKSQQVETPEIAELMKKANEFKTKARYTLLAINFLMIATSVFIGGIWYYYQPEFLSTKIGIIICILAMIIYVALHNTMIPLVFKNTIELNAKAELQQLIKLKEKQRFLQTVLLNAYFLLLSVGLCLYMYEYVSRMELLWAVFSYGILFLWIGLNAFYFRPKMANNQQNKLNVLIQNFKALNNQIID
ncbi:MAG: hypothetical protein ACJA2N_001799 [Salibacteraceae bacterium]|jgi:hypothetical protein